MSNLDEKAKQFEFLHGEKIYHKNDKDCSKLVIEVYKAGYEDCQKEYEEKVNELLSALEQIANATQPFNAFENEVFVSVATDIARKALSFNNAT